MPASSVRIKRHILDSNITLIQANLLLMRKDKMAASSYIEQSENCFPSILTLRIHLRTTGGLSGKRGDLRRDMILSTLLSAKVLSQFNQDAFLCYK